MKEREFIPVKVGVLTVSDTRTEVDDGSGDIITKLLEADGHRVVARHIVTDDRDAIRGRLEMWIEDPDIEVVIATGGTGVTPRDVTPEALAPLVTKPIPGFGELFRWLSYDDIGAATIQSRAEAALCQKTYVFLLPGSPRACEFAMRKILLPQLDHRTRPCNFVMLLPRIRSERED